MSLLRLPAALVLLISAVATPTSAHAQNTTASAGSPKKSVQHKLVTLPSVAPVLSPGLAATFDATTDEKKGSVAIAVANASETFTFSLTGSGPLDKESKEAAPISLGGLSSGAVLEFGLNWFYWKDGAESPLEIEAFCLEKTGKAECERTSFEKPEDRRRYDELTGVDQNPWIISTGASVGRTDFKFLTASSLQPGTEQHNDAGFTFSIGQYVPSRGYISVGYEYQRAWEPAGGPRQVCVPLATSVIGAQECKSAVIGGPKRARAQLATMQWRKFFKGGKVAINPSAVRDFEDKVTAASLPVYFFTNANAGLAGGARFGWRSDTKSWSFSVFVGTVLAIID